MRSTKQPSMTPPSDEELMAAMVAQLEESTTTAVAALDSALAHFAAARAHQAERRAKWRAQTQAEFAHVDPAAFAELVVAEPPERAK